MSSHEYVENGIAIMTLPSSNYHFTYRIKSAIGLAVFDITMSDMYMID